MNTLKMDSSPKFIYFGSFRVSADILEHLIQNGFMPEMVVCNPDKIAGRKKELTPPEIKTRILENQWPIQILQPEKVEAIAARLISAHADFFVVMGYPQILQKQIFKIPKLGTIGVHPSLLPKYRGASPMQSALLAGEEKTGVTLYLMDEKMDHGPILAQQAVEIAQNETNTSLEKKSAVTSGSLLAKIIPDFLAEKIQPVQQEHALATFTRKFNTADGEVDIQKNDPQIIYRKIRALNPEPGVFTYNFPGRENKRVKLLEARIEDTQVTITKIQPDGKKPFPISYSLAS